MVKNISKEWLIILSLVVLKLLIHFLTNTNYGLHRDTFLYYSLGEHLDWGYLSVPPFIAIVSKLSVFLFGKTIFAMRFFPAIIGGVSIIIIGKIIKELKGGSWAIIIAGLAFILSPSFLRSNTLFQPVSFNQFFWLLSAFLIVRMLKTGNAKIWISIFIVIGFAFLNKYSISFFILSFLLTMLFTKYRSLFKSKFFFIGGILSIIIILPNLIWQYNHNWPVINHMNELHKYQLVNVSYISFFIDQLMMNFPGIIVWTSGLIIFLFFRDERKYRLLGILCLFIILSIMLLRGKSYYTLGVYPILFAMGGYAIEKYFTIYMKYITMVFIILISLPMFPFSVPVFSHKKMVEYSKLTAEFTNRWEDGKIYNLPQDYADMTGWEELSKIVIQTYSNLSDENKNRCIIYAENYASAGAILFYGEEYGLPVTISFSDNFLLWAPDNLNSDFVIYVNDEIGDMKSLFDSVVLAGQVDNPFFRENGIQVYVCSQPKENFRPFYASKVNELKNKFR